MNFLHVEIKNIKSISKLTLDLPIEKGLYAITGQNASGKSTLITCIASSFFNMQMSEYLGKTADNAEISFKLGNGEKTWKKAWVWGKNRKRLFGWRLSSNKNFILKGFYEGSIIYGNRFRNTSYESLKNLDRINTKKLVEVDDFIRINLGKILHNNEKYYDSVLKLELGTNSQIEYKFKGDVFYYQKNNNRVSQFHMSTGENLLISVLNSILKRNQDRATKDVPCLLLLDEIELALHPSSLKRLVAFLEKISNEFNYAIYFSTHSIELISHINPESIFFLEKHSDNSIEILNPCYPAYATRILYDHEGYDYIIMVEDDLAKGIVKAILRDNSLINNKLIHVLPCGGYTNTIDLANEVVNSNLTGKLSQISIILDRDIKDDAERYIISHSIKNNIPLNYLPIDSLEKFLKKKLYSEVDHKFFRFLNDFVFHQKSLHDLINEYEIEINKSGKNDNDGKKFYKILEQELKERNKSRTELIDLTVQYLSNNKTHEYNSLLSFLKEKLS